jgi:hypothetical protein
MRCRFRYLSAAVTVALCVAGCGGSDSGSSLTSYRASVNKICATYNAKITALPAKTASTISGLAKVEGEASAGLHQIKALTPPGSMSARVNRWVDSLKQSYTDASQAIAALRAGDVARARSFALAGAALNSRDNAEARSLGLPSCAANPQPSGS